MPGAWHQGLGWMQGAGNCGWLQSQGCGSVCHKDPHPYQVKWRSGGILAVLGALISRLLGSAVSPLALEEE